jgi:hypothetical protein
MSKQTQKRVQFIKVTEVIGDRYQVTRDIAVLGVSEDGLTDSQVHELLSDYMQATNNPFEAVNGAWWTHHDGYVFAEITDDTYPEDHAIFQVIQQVMPGNIWTLE